MSQPEKLPVAGEVVHLAAFAPNSEPRGKAQLASVVPFPLGKSSAVVQVHTKLRDLRGKQRRLFWHETVAELRERLTAAGIPESIVAREIWSFHAAVQSRLAREIDLQGRRGGDAA